MSGWYLLAFVELVAFVALFMYWGRVEKRVRFLTKQHRRVELSKNLPKDLHQITLE